MGRRLLVVGALEDVGNRVDRDDKEEDARNREEDQAGDVELQERPEPRLGGSAPKECGRREVCERRGEEDAETDAEILGGERQKSQGGGRENEEGQGPFHRL